MNELEQVLAIAKEKYDKCSDSEKLLLESIFPQLKKLTDNEIRLEIIEYINKNVSGDKLSIWIDYLERVEHPWKPTKEQLKVLNDLRISTSDTNTFVILDSIYSELLRLK